MPLFCQALDGNASDKVSLVAAMEALANQLHIRHGPGPVMALVLRLEPVHQQVLALLGPAYEEFYTSTN